MARKISFSMDPLGKAELEHSKKVAEGIRPLFDRGGSSQIHPQSKLKLTWLKPSANPLRVEMRQDAFESLKESIRQHGILEPLVVRLLEDHYEIICGHRRFEAARELDLTEVPVTVRNLDDREAYILSLHENLHRDDLSPIEEARAYQKMVEGGMVKSQRELAGILGVTEGRVSQKLKLLVLPPEVQELVFTRVKSSENADPEKGLFLESGGLTERHARAIARLKTPEERVKLAQEVAAQQLTVEATERRVIQELGETPEKGPLGGRKKRVSEWVEMGAVRYKATGSGLLVQVRSGDRREQMDGLRKVMKSMDEKPSSKK